MASAEVPAARARLRIAHVTTARVRGGLLRMLETLAGLQARRHEILILSPQPPEIAAVNAPVKWTPLDLMGNRHLLRHLALLRRLAAYTPDVVVFHSGSPGECAIAAALASIRWPVVVVEHAPDVYPRRSPFRDHVFARCKSAASTWVAVSAAGARALEGQWQLPPNSIAAVHNGAALPPDGPPPTPAESGPFGRANAVLGSGTPGKGKGYDTFEAIAGALAASYPEVRWVWVGGTQIGRSGPVELLPWTASLGWMLRRSTLILLPSRAEGLPLLLLEAWACAQPVVASRVGGIPEVMIDGVNGLLLDPEGVETWITAVSRLLGDPDARRALGLAGQQTWREGLTANAMEQRWEGVIAAARQRWIGPSRS